jgi:hypothetical protein
VVAVLAAVLHQRRPGHALAQGVPHVGESLGRHVRVAHQVVRLADQLLRGEAAGVHESRIGVNDVALRVGGRQQGAAFVELVLALGHGLVVSHGRWTGSLVGLDLISPYKRFEPTQKTQQKNRNLQPM